MSNTTLSRHTPKCVDLASARLRGQAKKPSYEDLCDIVLHLQQEVDRLSTTVRGISRCSKKETKKRVDVIAWLKENRPLDTHIEDYGEVSDSDASSALDHALAGNYAHAVLALVDKSLFASFQHAPKTLYCHSKDGWSVTSDETLDILIKRVDGNLMMAFTAREYTGDDYLKGVHQLMAKGIEHKSIRGLVRKELGRACRVTIAVNDTIVVTDTA